MKKLFLFLFLLLIPFSAYGLPNADWTAGSSNFGISGDNINQTRQYCIHNGVLYIGARKASGGTAPLATLLRTTDGAVYTSVNVGFVAAENEARSCYSASDGYLYLVTQRGAGARLWRSLDGETSWTMVIDFGTTVNYGRRFLENGGYLYHAIVSDEGSAAVLYRCLMSAGCGTSGNWFAAWTAPDTTLERILSLIVDNGTMFLTTNRVSSGQAGGVFSSTNGTTWTKINTTVLAVAASGTLAHSIVKFKGNFYIGTQDATYGGAIWKSSDRGITWTKVSTDGMGEGLNLPEAYILTATSNALFIGFRAGTGLDAKVFVTMDGSNFKQIGSAGLGNSGNNQIFDFILFNNNVHAGGGWESSTDNQPIQPFLLPYTARLPVSR